MNKSNFKKLLKKLKVYFFPTELDREVRKYNADGGDDYFRYDYDLDSNSLVLDFGGYKGQWASDIYSRYSCNIMIFEPIHDFFKNIEKRFTSNKKITCYQYALGSSNRFEDIFLDNDGSTVYANSNNKELIEFKEVGDFFRELHITNVDLVKVNIEGGEYELLPKLVQLGIIKSIKYLQIQFHKLDDGSEEELIKIRKSLSKTHKPIYQYKFVWESWERIDN
jgi:FkbM family methyltransferase